MANSGYGTDITNQQAGNYAYDAIGNMVSDIAGGITGIAWTVYGKIQSVAKASGTVNYTYDASGNRISKVANGVETWYVRDATGNVMATYTKGDVSINSGNLTQAEVDLYGSSRLALLNTSVNCSNNGNGPAALGNAWDATYNRGQKLFELTNHLGNVLATTTDRLVPVPDASGNLIDYYLPDVASATDYYSHGMQMPGRTFSAGNAYRYGFNGKENDRDINDGALNFEGRVYDGRTGRWMSTDMHPKDYLSPYSFARNSPTNIIDPDGNDEYHFHYVTVPGSRVLAGPDGILHMVPVFQTIKWVNIVHNDLKNTFYVYKDAAKNNGSLSANAPTQFFPDPYSGGVPKTGITKTSYFGGILVSNDNDNIALEKTLDDFPELKGIVTRPMISSTGSHSVEKDNLDFWATVYQQKANRATAEKEQAEANQVVLFIAEGLVTDFVFGGVFTETMGAWESTAKVRFLRTVTNAGVGRNVGYLEGTVGGSYYSTASVSGDALRDLTVKNPGNRIFTTTGTVSDFDSEVKLLEDFAGKYGKTPNISGNLNLVSERPFCTSCTGVIEQFQKTFPNVKINLINGIK